MSDKLRAEVPPALDGERIDRALATITGLARGEVAALVGAGAVSLDGEPVRTRSRRVAGGALIEMVLTGQLPRGPREIAADEEVEVPVVLEDGEFVVVDKPAGLVVHPGAGNPGGTLVNGLLARYPEMASVGAPERPGIVHRLDRSTSGLMVVARTPRSYAALVAQLAARSVSRRYLALVLGHLEAASGIVDAPIGRSMRDRTRMAVSNAGRGARTRYDVLRRFDEPLRATLVECALETGRTHQIRVHMGAIGHPVAGDRRYGGTAGGLDLARPFLHARRLGFDHPLTGRRVEVTSEPPGDLEVILERMS